MTATNRTGSSQGRRGRLFVVSGPSGVGKSTLLGQALPRTGAVFSVSATTRRPRPGEQDGRDYFFVSREEFERMQRGGELLEWAQVFGELYGTPAAPVERMLDQGRPVVLDIDVQGALQVRQKAPGAVLVLVVPPDEDELRRRLMGRRTDSPAQQAQRLAKATAELSAARASGAYDYEVVNDKLEAAVERLVRILQQESGQA